MTGVNKNASSVAPFLDYLTSINPDELCETQSPQRDVDLPKAGQFILRIFLNEHEHIYVIGDLLEEYQNIRAKKGRIYSAYWFYVEVFNSLGPLLCRSFKPLLIPMPDKNEQMLSQRRTKTER